MKGPSEHRKELEEVIERTVKERTAQTGGTTDVVVTDWLVLYNTLAFEEKDGSGPRKKTGSNYFSSESNPTTLLGLLTLITSVMKKAVWRL